MRIARLSDQAKNDLAEIWEYIAEESPSSADRLIQRLVRQYKSLAENPGMGRLRAELRPGLRSFPVGNYLMFYRPIPEGIAVLRIIHGARDLEALFEREPEETYRFDDEAKEDEHDT
jgi:toxin ParE1/3/4